MGRVRLSMKAAAEDEAQKVAPPAAAQAEAPATPAA
jgi:hypothetical protein